MRSPYSYKKAPTTVLICEATVNSFSPKQSYLHHNMTTSKLIPSHFTIETDLIDLLDPYEFHVYAKILSDVQVYGASQQSLKSLSYDLKIGRTKLTQVIKSLVEKNLIEKKYRQGYESVYTLSTGEAE